MSLGGFDVVMSDEEIDRGEDEDLGDVPEEMEGYEGTTEEADFTDAELLEVLTEVTAVLSMTFHMLYIL